VLVDALPLLSLVQSEPLRLQSSHLSFQEYFAASALCEEGTKLSGTPPWQWPAWWANAVELGAQMGDGFGRGLLRAAGVTGGTLDLSQKLGGDPPTVRRVLVAMMKTTALTSLSVAKNNIDGEGAQLLATAALGSSSLEVLSGVPIKKLRAGKLTKLDLQGKGLGATEGIVLAELMQLRPVLTSLDVGCNNLNEQAALGIVRAARQHDKITNLGLSNCGIGPIGATEIADYIQFTAVLTRLDLESNNIGPEGAIAIAEALKVNAVVTTLFLNWNRIGDEGAIAIAEALKVTAVVNTLDLGGNRIGDEGAKAIAEALKVNAVLTSVDLQANSIGDDGAKAIAEALKVNAVLTSVDLRFNSIHDDGAKAIAEALKVNAVLTNLDIRANEMVGDAGEKAVRDAVKDRSGFELKL
jgi:Ran GTPase-activating protein (RanGAP) involved in mRNA processing and transport